LEYNITSITADNFDEYKARLIRNYYRTCNHNEEYENGNSTFEQFVCKRCYLPYDEIVKRRGGIIELPKRTPRALQIPPVCRLQKIPPSFNWVEMGGLLEAILVQISKLKFIFSVVTPVQDQKSCGSKLLLLVRISSSIIPLLFKLVTFSLHWLPLKVTSLSNMENL
jgi:hypothetical protein